jgi:predicted nucleic acid-binding protein
VVGAPLTFVDTNVLASAHDRSETARQSVARALVEGLWRDRAGVLSTQVLQELYVVATLVTEDLQAGRSIRGVTVENPFA